MSVTIKYFSLLCLIIAVAFGHVEDANKISDELSGLLRNLSDLLKNVSKSLPKDSNLGDIGNFFKSTKVSKRDVNSNSNLVTMKAELKRKCFIYGLPENYPSVEVAIEKFDSCINVVAHRIRSDKINGLDRTTNVECRYAPEVNSCFVNYTDALQPCLPRYRGGNFPFANISGAVIDYLCGDQEAQQRTKFFLENSTTCIYSKMANVEKCLNSSFPEGSYPKIEENAYLFSEENCRKLSELKKCVNAELQGCSPSVINFLEGLNSVVERFYAPCPTDQLSDHANLIK